MANSVLNYIINVVKKGDGDKQTLSSLGTLKSVMTGVGVAAGVATTAYVALDRTLGEASRKTIKYAEDVRKLSSITNQGAEETSKLIQTMDDFKISADQLTVASKKLASQGLSPTVETMAQLSDEYLKINDGAKRAEFLTKNFGKAGLEMAEAMQAGGDAIRRQSEGINKNLILTEKQVRAARQLEIAQDNLNDTWEAFSISVGTKVMPALTEMTKSLNNWAKVVDWASLKAAILADMGKGPTQAMYDYASEADIAAQKTREWTSATEDAAAALNDDLYGAIVSSGSAVADMYGEIGRAALIAGQAARGVTGEAAAKELLDFELSMGMITQEVYNTKVELIGVGDELTRLDGREAFFKVTMLKYGFSSVSDAFSVDKPKGKDGKSGKVGGAVGEALGGPIRAGGWTVVGEHGKELIDPGGYVHSNAESRRLVAMGLTPMRGLAVGGDSDGGVFKPVKTGLAGLVASGRISATNISSVISGVSSGSASQTAVSPTASIVQAAQTTALVNQSAVTTQSAATIGAAAAEISSSTKEGNILSSRQNEDMLALLESINAGVRDIPRATVAAAAKVIK